MSGNFTNQVSRRPPRSCSRLRCRAASIALFQLMFVLSAESSDMRNAEARGVAQPLYAAGESGILEGTVSLACRHGAINCQDRPYPVALFIQSEREGTPPIHVDANPNFSISLAPGTYTVSSADARSWWGLPTLEPITVVIRPRGVTHVDVRFAPGPELPKR
jgi:hypothetical protein